MQPTFPHSRDMQTEDLMGWLEETHRVWTYIHIVIDVIKAVQFIYDFIHWMRPRARAPSPAAAAFPATTALCSLTIEDETARYAPCSEPVIRIANGHGLQTDE